MAVGSMPLWSYSTQKGSAFGSWRFAPSCSVQVNGFDPSHCWGACAAAGDANAAANTRAPTTSAPLIPARKVPWLACARAS